MFDKMLSSMGIGAPKVDTILFATEIVRGDNLRGEFRLVGGKAGHEINKIDIELQTLYSPQAGDAKQYETVLRHHAVSEHFRLKPGEEKVLPFEMLVPMLSPVSMDLSQVWLRTELDVAWAIDPNDVDPIRVLPDPATARLLAAARDLGFSHGPHSGRCLANSEEFDDPFYQVFEFEAAHKIGHKLGDRVKSLDLMVRANSYDIDAQLELNRQGQHRRGWLPPQGKVQGACLRFRLRQDEPFPAEAFEALILGLLA